MVKRCVAAGCSNTHSQNVSLFQFPRDPVLRRQWVKQVQRTRAKWSASDHSVLCSEHFASDSFEPDFGLALGSGLSKRRRLKCDAVPTLFTKTSELRRMHSETTADQPTSSLGKRTASEASAVDDSSSVKTKRSAYAKRERCRVCPRTTN